MTHGETSDIIKTGAVVFIVGMLMSLFDKTSKAGVPIALLGLIIALAGIYKLVE